MEPESTQIKSAEFVKSAQHIGQCPPATLPEYAFIGRSNVGKSTLINYLTNHGKLAKTSSKPGKTKLINHFIINDNWYLVDLPGYGYAKTSKTDRKMYDKMIRDYITKRSNLVNVFVLVDSNIPPQEKDLDFMEWLGTSQIPFSIVFTKCDKSKEGKIEDNLHHFQQAMLQKWEELPPMFSTSANKSEGGEALLEMIAEYNQMVRTEIENTKA